MLFLLGAGAFLALDDRAGWFSGPALRKGPDPAIVVLPLAADPALERWGVDVPILLSLSLDQTVGLRAIDGRTTVAAAARSATSSGSPPDGEATLALGRAVGARWVLAGSIRSRGEELLLSLSGRDLEESKELERVEVRGRADRIIDLADHASAAILAALGPSYGSAPPLARVATASQAALEAFLDGERRYRSGRLDAAANAYGRALRIDPEFALAAFRASRALRWIEGGRERSRIAIVRARRNGDRLSPRYRAFVGAAWRLAHHRIGGLETLREAVLRYPDDPDAWELLGETVFRLGPQAGVADPAEIEYALARATHRAPDFPPVRVHRIDAAISPGADPVRARALLDTLAALAPDAWFTRDRRLRVAVAFGDSADRTEALDALAADPRRALAAGRDALWHVSHLDAQIAALEIAATDPVSVAEARVLLALNHLRRGQIRPAVEVAGSPDVPPSWRAGVLLRGHFVRFPIPASEIERAVASLDMEEADPVTLFWAGVWAEERGRAEERGAALARMRRFASRTFETGDSLEARFAVGAARALEGFVEWRRGETRGALRRLEGALHDATGTGERALVNALVRWWVAEIHEEEGHPRQALHHYGSFWGDPSAMERCAAIHAAVGDSALARRELRTLLYAWRQADRVLEPRLAAARERLSELAPRESTDRKAR